MPKKVLYCLSDRRYSPCIGRTQVLAVRKKRLLILRRKLESSRHCTQKADHFGRRHLVLLRGSILILPSEHEGPDRQQIPRLYEQDNPGVLSDPRLICRIILFRICRSAEEPLLHKESAAFCGCGLCTWYRRGLPA